MAISSLLSVNPIYLLSAAILACFFYIIAYSRNAQLGHIPGPFLARYTDLWRGFQGWRYYGKDMNYQRQCAQTYGDVARVGPRMVLLSDPEAIQIVMGFKERLEKGPGYRAFLQGGVNASGLVAIPDEYTHGRYRRPVAHAYSLSSLKGYEPHIDEMIQKLVSILDEAITSGREINMSDWLHYWSFDVIGKLTFGHPIGFMEQGSDFNKMIGSQQKFLKYVDVVGNMPILDYLFKRNPIFKLIPAKPSNFYLFANGILQDRLSKTDIESSSPPKTHTDLLSAFIAAKKTHPDVVTDFRVAMYATTNVAAGTLSTSLTLDRVMLFLAQEPAAQDRLYQEVRSVDHGDSGEGEGPAALALALKMPYLEAVILESYRLHSSAANNLERIVSPAGMDLPSGQHLPPGTVMSFNSPAMSRHPDIYGPDVLKYDPQRWMQREGEKDEEFRMRKARMERTMLTFGYGSRSCLGKSVVQLEMFKVWATLMALFKFEAVRKPRKHEIWVRVKRREVAKEGVPLVAGVTSS